MESTIALEPTSSDVIAGLPWELFDGIIDHLPPGDEKSLRNCSLVAKSWIHSTRKRLFKTVHIRPKNLQSWLNNISPTNATLLGYVRLLFYHGATLLFGYLAIDGYFPSLSELRYLFIRTPSCPRRMELFHAFQHTLSGVSLSDCSVTKSQLVTFINYFPNLESLFLSRLHHLKEDTPIPPLYRSSFKRLHIDEWPDSSLVLLDELSKLGLRFDEVILYSTTLSWTWPVFAKRVISTVAATAKHLTILLSPRDNNRFLTLLQGQELRKYEIFMFLTDEIELDSISARLVNVEWIISAVSFSSGLWTHLDGILVDLVEQRRYQLKLEVKFARSDADKGTDLRNYLPMFHDRGQARVLEANGEPFHCSEWIGTRSRSMQLNF